MSPLSKDNGGKVIFLLKKNIERQIKFRTRKMAAAKDLNSNGSLFGRALNIVF